jgi:hypothetical protein
VISVRGKCRDTLKADPAFRYVGRCCRGWSRSGYANPFRVGEEYWTKHGELFRCRQPGDAAELFAGCLWDAATGERLRIPGLYEMEFAHISEFVAELKGLTLGCWCTEYATDEPFRPAPCHAVILAELAERDGRMPADVKELMPWLARD